MKNIKDITLSIFAIIGFISIITAFNTQPQQQTHGTPESHVWELHLGTFTTHPTFAINKVSGEVRKYSLNTIAINKDGDVTNQSFHKYSVMKPVE